MAKLRVVREYVTVIAGGLAIGFTIGVTLIAAFVVAVTIASSVASAVSGLFMDASTSAPVSSPARPISGLPPGAARTVEPVRVEASASPAPATVLTTAPGAGLAPVPGAGSVLQYADVLELLSAVELSAIAEAGMSAPERERLLVASVAAHFPRHEWARAVSVSGCENTLHKPWLAIVDANGHVSAGVFMVQAVWHGAVPVGIEGQVAQARRIADGYEARGLPRWGAWWWCSGGGR